MPIQRATSGQIVDLRPFGRRVKEAKSTALVKTARFEAIRLVVLAGTEIPSHRVGGSIALHCLEGRVALGLPRSTLELAAGDWVYLDDGQAHSLAGLEDASLLLTIFFDD